MKKRFKNILTGYPKKNGLFVCMCTICVTLISGMLIGCSAIKSDSEKEPMQTELETMNPNIEDILDTQAENDSVQADTADDGSIDISDNTQDGNAANPAEQQFTSDVNNYRSVLLGKSNFICTDLENKSLNISEIGQAITADDSAAVSVVKFAVIDLDDDGEDETVLWLQNGMYDCGFEILHEQNGEIYGYTLWYRAFMELKADGTFMFSSGAADSGIGKMSFSETGYSINSQADSQSGYNSENELTVEYFINNEPCSEDEFYDRISAQEQKANAEWYDLSEDNVNAVLE